MCEVEAINSPDIKINTVNRTTHPNFIHDAMVTVGSDGSVSREVWASMESKSNIKSKTQNPL